MSIIRLVVIRGGSVGCVPEKLMIVLAVRIDEGTAEEAVVAGIGEDRAEGVKAVVKAEGWGVEVDSVKVGSVLVGTGDGGA